MFQLVVTNDCKAPRFVHQPSFGSYRTRAAAEKAAKVWNSHIASFNRVMEQNVVYAVEEAK